MADDPYVRIAQLEAELRQSRAENATLSDEGKRRDRLLAEALKHQTVTGEVLRVIASSPTDLDLVLTTVAESAARLCDINDVTIFGIEDGHFRPVARVGTWPDPPSRGVPINRQSIQGRAIVDIRPVHVPDVLAVTDTEFPVSALTSRRHGTRSALAVPLLREGVAIGAIYARRLHVQPFTETVPSRTARNRSRCWRRLPIRPSSRSRTPGCSRSWRSATGSWRKRWSSRPRRLRYSGLSPVRRPTCSAS